MKQRARAVPAAPSINIFIDPDLRPEAQDAGPAPMVEAVAPCRARASSTGDGMAVESPRFDAPAVSSGVPSTPSCGPVGPGARRQVPAASVASGPAASVARVPQAAPGAPTRDLRRRRGREEEDLAASLAGLQIRDEPPTKRVCDKDRTSWAEPSTPWQPKASLRERLFGATELRPSGGSSDQAAPARGVPLDFTHSSSNSMSSGTGRAKSGTRRTSGGGIKLFGGGRGASRVLVFDD